MKLVAAAATAIASALCFVSAVAAAPLEAAGTGTASAPVLTDLRIVDGNVLADFTQTGTIAGTFAGTFETSGNLVVFKDGRTSVQAVVTFTGTTACSAGTVAFVGTDETIGGVGSGRVVTIDASDDTAAIHAVADLVLTGPTFTYSGSYSCR